MQQGNTSFYVAADALNDNGWRDRSPSELRRIYADVGVLGDRSEFHVNFTGASNFFGAAAATPIEMLNQRWSSVYTTPQTTKNQLAFLNTTGSYQVSDTLSIKGNAYYRGFWQKHVDGNTSDVVPCDPAVFPGFLCFDEDDNPAVRPQRAPVPDTFSTAGRPARSTAPRRRRTGSAATLQAAEHGAGVRPQQQLRGRRERRPGPCAVQGLERARHHRPRSVRQRHRRHHRPARRVGRAGQCQDRQHLSRPVRDRHVRRDDAAVGHRRRPLQRGADQARRIRSARRSTAATSSAASIRSSARPTRSRRRSTPMPAIPRRTARRRRPSSPAPIRCGPACSTISSSPTRR